MALYDHLDKKLVSLRADERCFSIRFKRTNCSLQAHCFRFCFNLKMKYLLFTIDLNSFNSKKELCLFCSVDFMKKTSLLGGIVLDSLWPRFG